MRFRLSELAATIDGRLTGHDTVIDGVSIDSRTVKPGQLFVPIVAERDGHDFIPGALSNGAAAYLSAIGPSGDEGQHPCITVGDTGRALTALGSSARDRIGGPVIGITGSVGKTSVKDLTLAACNAANGTAWASAASFNNELGVPLTLANAPESASIMIVEMGARGIGHIAELCGVAKPTIGVVTCVALAHSELFGSLEAVAQAKGELISALPMDGTAILNADDPNVAAMAERTDASIITYGTGQANLQVSAATVDELLRPRFTIRSEWGTAELLLQVRGAHMAMNAAAALGAALGAGVGFDTALDGLTKAELSPWRMEVGRNSRGLIIVNDAYNANPTSMRAALRSLASLEAETRIAVVAEMAELGEEGPAEHLAVASEAVAAGITVIAIDAPAYGNAADHVAHRDEALDRLADLGEGAAVLVKGSRVAELEHLAQSLLEQ